jgi:hypothetical protein
VSVLAASPEFQLHACMGHPVAAASASWHTRLILHSIDACPTCFVHWSCKLVIFPCAALHAAAVCTPYHMHPASSVPS